ncbi:efflux RND transporter periplasmic adaptor subunit [Staphylococcus devriesei]|uniref:efflux RND transporter periplasmic adaptor subunit n=1 Tax=Staphylococcus devriesei TaxID=586733 RepID=UPI001F46B651|nr:efflux RND transporter periplasmic adaptor subunit [Staphylococcus devriesei]
MTYLKKHLTPLTILIPFLLLLILIFSYYIYLKLPSQPNLSKVKTIIAKPHYPLSFTGIQEAKESYTVYYNPSLGEMPDILVTNNATVKPHTPLLEYYNTYIGKLIVAKKKTLVSIRSLQPITEPLSLATINLYDQIAELQSRLRIQLSSPIQGKVTILHSFPSKSNTKIMQINSEKRIIRATITESQLSRIKVNQTVMITPKSSPLFTGRVLSISSTPFKIEKNKSMYHIIVSTKAQYPIGYHFKIESGAIEFQVPTSVIYDKHYIFVTQNNKIIKRKIKYNKSQKSGYIIVFNGINIGDKIIVNPTSSLLQNNE